MSQLGKQVRLGRLFRHPSGRFLGVAVDHMINYPSGMPEGLCRIGANLPKIAAGEPSAIVMNKGTALRLMAPYAGKVPLIVQQMALRADEPAFAEVARPDEVAAMGADAIAVAFSGSQKTLMVGAYIALAVGPLAILPMVAYHAAQLIVDTLVADWWRARSESQA